MNKVLLHWLVLFVGASIIGVLMPNVILAAIGGFVWSVALLAVDPFGLEE